MTRWKSALWLAVIGVTMASSVTFEASGAPPVSCTPPHRLRILDLGMVPDPVRPGQRIQLWKVKLKSDWNGECLTSLEVRDRDQIAGKRVQYLITPGDGLYTFQAEPGYSFQARDYRCFTVLVNVGNTWTPIDPQKAFCTKLGQGGWSLK